MDLKIRAMTPEEREYSYTQDAETRKKSGCIGHLRVDMDSNGLGFYSTWDDHSPGLKTDARPFHICVRSSQRCFPCGFSSCRRGGGCVLRSRQGRKPCEPWEATFRFRPLLALSAKHEREDCDRAGTGREWQCQQSSLWKQKTRRSIL